LQIKNKDTKNKNDGSSESFEKFSNLDYRRLLLKRMAVGDIFLGMTNGGVLDMLVGFLPLCVDYYPSYILGSDLTGSSPRLNIINNSTFSFISLEFLFIIFSFLCYYSFQDFCNCKIIADIKIKCKVIEEENLLSNKEIQTLVSSCSHFYASVFFLLSLPSLPHILRRIIIITLYNVVLGYPSSVRFIS
jgi:hypothetical protein